MTAGALALLVAALLTFPHLLSRADVDPVIGAILWVSNLALRAALSIFAVVYFMEFIPRTDVFEAVTGWCLHAVVPSIPTHLSLSGHWVGDAVSLAPTFALLITAVTAVFGAWRAVRAVRAWLGRNALGAGPGDSLVVGGSELLVATAGLREPRVIVSAGALLVLDDEELDAGLQHEWGHVKRGHRLVTLASTCLLACSKLLPGGQTAFRHLQFHLERDADEYAVRQTGNPTALASAICKLASSRAFAAPPGFVSLAGNDVVQRLQLLLAGPVRPTGGRKNLPSSALSAAAGIAALTLFIALPGMALAGVSGLHLPAGAMSGCTF